MLKKIIFLMIISFLLQMNWSMAGAYCTHESGSAGQHIGHHQHQHIASNLDDGTGNKQSVSGSHVDCASCFSVLNLAVISESKMIPTTSVKHEDTHQLKALLIPYLAFPERPKWLVAV